MRIPLVLGAVLAVSTAVLGACGSTTTTPNKPPSTPAPLATASPAASPVASPSGTPIKPGVIPGGKKTEDKKTPDAKDVNKNVKLQGTPIKPA